MFWEPRELPSEAAQRRTAQTTRWDIAFLACLCLVAISTALAAWQRFHGDHVTTTPSRWDMALTFLLTGGIPFAWLLRTRVRPLKGTLDYLRLRNLRRAAPWGLGVGAAMAIAAVIVLRAIPASPPSLGDLLRMAWFYCLVAPVGEEILFRGILQPRVGITAQALAFAAMHIATITVLEGALVVSFGIALGYAAHRWGLWASIVAHATYNLAALL